MDTKEGDGAPTQQTGGMEISVRRSKRHLRIAVSVLLGGTVLWVLFASPLATSQISTVTSELTPDRESWYWRDNAKVNPPGTGQQQETFPVAAQQDHLQVALEGGQDDKRTFLGFNLSEVQDFDGSTVRRFRLTAEVSQTSPEHGQKHQEDAEGSQTAVPPQTSNADAAEMIACPVTGFMAGGADGDPMTSAEGNSNHPEFDCGLATGTGSASDNGSTWTFDLTRIAQLWADGETIDSAVVLKPALEPPQPPDPASSWTVEFHGRALDGLSAQATYTPSGASSEAGAGFSPIGSPESEERTGGDTAVSAPTAPAGTGTDSTPSPAAGTTPDPTEEEPQAVSQQPARSVGPSSQFPWYAALPWPLAALALWLVYRSLRDDDEMGAARHRVANLLRGRGAEADDTQEIPAAVGSGT